MAKYLAPVIALAILAAAAGQVVQTKDGPVIGFTDKSVEKFLGIPFAAPPVGNLRWKSPQPVTAWTSDYFATGYKPACYQHNDTFTVLNKVSEDCLYLNVYAPVNATNLPVMIFFYGGSWAEGAASFLLYDGEFVVRALKDVVIVTANYRLNVFGFLGSADLQKEDSLGSAGNYGLQDQRAAMQWVQNNIAGFGGNPNLVTIFGESAGAGSVSCHLIMERSAGLFQRAAMESGPISDWTAQPMYAAQLKYDVLTAHTGCNSSSDVLSCLRALPASQVYSWIGKLPSALMGLLQWGPVVDGSEILDDPRNLAAAGKFASKVPVLLGTNMDEGTIFTRANKNINETGMLQYLSEMFGASMANTVAAQYPLSAYSGDHPENTAWWTLSHIFGDSQMSCPARSTARALAAAGQPVYLYFFSHILEIIQLFVPFKGCCHGSELPFVFDGDIVLLGSGEPALGTAFATYWTSFAANGNPNYNGGVEWPAYTAANDANIRMDIPITSETGLKSALCDFWDKNQLSYSQLWPTVA